MSSSLSNAGKAAPSSILLKHQPQKYSNSQTNQYALRAITKFKAQISQNLTPQNFLPPKLSLPKVRKTNNSCKARQNDLSFFIAAFLA